PELRQSDGRVVPKNQQNLPGDYAGSGFPHARLDRSKHQFPPHKLTCWLDLAAHSGKYQTSHSTRIPICCKAPEHIDPANRKHLAKPQEKDRERLETPQTFKQCGQRHLARTVTYRPPAYLLPDDFGRHRAGSFRRGTVRLWHSLY